MRSRAIVEFNFDALLRSDRAARADARSKEIQFGQITPNEARAEEGRPPMAGGDELYVNSTMIPLTRARNPVVTPEGGNNGI
jgi:hypothetical protein